MFSEQVNNCSVLYLHGGTTKDLISAIRQNGQWQKELDGKVVAGSSAGANAIGRFYWGLHSLKVEEGLGLLPIKVISHFRSDYNAPNIDWNRACEELSAHGPSLPIMTLAEGQCVVV